MGKLAGDVVLGIPELDRDLTASLPPGWLGLLVGSAGSATSLFAKQFAHAGLGSSPVLYYSVYESTSDVERAFHDFGWDPSGLKIFNLAEEYYQKVLLRDLEISRLRERGLSYGEVAGVPVSVSNPRTFNLTSRLLADLAALDSPFRLVLDSLDFLLEILEPEAVLTVARQIRHRAQTLGGMALLSIQGDIHERRTTGLLEDMADLVIELQALPQAGGYEHRIAVSKIRNHPERSRIASAQVTGSGFGLLDAPVGATSPPSR
ncbi:MAG: RAD55 family ATPase [Thermoplasmata archaeon]|nr:RAD55 family ATPase [Thermoplasmata archaeon]